MKLSFRLLSLLLLLALTLSALVSCDPASNVADTTAAETEAPEPALIIDQTYRVVIAAEADATTQKAADLLVSTVKEKTGLELTVVTDAEAATAREIVLGQTNRANTEYGEETYSVSWVEEALYLGASDSTTLYFAVDKVLETWLTPDFGLVEAGKLTLPESRVADLNELTLRSANSFTIMTQNMRGSDDPDGNSVPKRYERFLRLLADYQPDIIGTQEHTSNWYIRFERLFGSMTENGDVPLYGMVGETMDGPGKKGAGRNAILYRMDRFELLETETFWLSETPNIPSRLLTAEHTRNCTWVLLKDKQTGETILVVNTHLDHLSENARIQQITILMEYMAERVGDYPFYLTGDLNCGSRSSTYAYLSETLLDAKETAWVNGSTASGTYHGYRPGGFGSTIDHIFHDGSTTPVYYEIVSKDYDGFVSDHYGVIVEFVYP